MNSIFKWDTHQKLFVPDDKVGRNCWVSPNGRIFNCTAHEICAKHIVNVFCNKDVPCAGEYLVEKKWAKFTTSCMGEFYKADGLYDDLTAEQKEIYEKYFDV